MARLHVRLNEETDQDIIAWLDTHADKTAAVKDAIRAAMDGEPAAVDLDLCAIRAVFETVLDERFAGLALAHEETETHEDQELADKLDAMF